jgi:hypothetical protein
MSVARSRPAAAGALEVYVALSETTTAVALMRDGALITAHEAPWGFLDPDHRLIVRRKSQIAAYLGAHLEAFLQRVRVEHGPVSAVYICGGFPELRSMTVSLIECLDLEVDPLDSLFGIDAGALPEEGLDIRERAAELRMAWAAAVDLPAPLDLLRDRRQQRQRAWIARAAVAAGMATGLGLGVAVQSSGWGLTAVPISAATIASPSEPAIAAAGFVRSYEPPPDAVFTATRTGHPAPAVAGAADKPAAPAASAARGAAAVEVPVAPPAPLQFAGELQTILYGPERRLAVIDGRILQPGDEIRGVRIVEITPTAVVVRDRMGRQARLHVGQNR